MIVNEEVYRLVFDHLNKGVSYFYDLTLSDRLKLTYAYLNCDYKWAHEFLTEDDSSEQMLNMFIDYLGNPTMENGYSCLDIMKKVAIHYNSKAIQKIFDEISTQIKEDNKNYKQKSWQKVMSEETGIPLQGPI